VPVDPDLIAAVTVPGAILGIAVSFMHYASKWRAAKVTPQHDVENRLARLEVAIDDMTAELSRVSEGQQTMTRLLTDRSHEASHAAR
jgi:hypothetical protein